MGYFSNGTESQIYEDKYCSKCVHEGQCAVWLAHLLRNYDECNNEESILHLLIPKTKDGWNGKCKMFHAGESPYIKAEQKSQNIRETINPAYSEWAKEKGLI